MSCAAWLLVLAFFAARGSKPPVLNYDPCAPKVAVPPPPPPAPPSTAKPMEIPVFN